MIDKIVFKESGCIAYITNVGSFKIPQASHPPSFRIAHNSLWLSRSLLLFKSSRYSCKIKDPPNMCYCFYKLEKLVAVQQL